MKRCGGLIILFLLLVKSLSAGQIEVCKTCEVSTISQAVKMAEAGDVLLIRGGLYKEYDIVIDKPLEIIGEENAIIDGEKQGHIFEILSDSVSISGLTLLNVGQSYTKDFAAIYISRSKYFKISNVTLKNIFFGILVEKSSFGVIEHNRISGQATDEVSAGNGIHLWSCSNISIENNEIHNVRDGIYFEFVKNSKISNNYSHSNIRYGLHFMFSNNDEYHNNTFSNNGAGVAVMFSKFIIMTNNTFIKNWGTASYGLLLKEIYDAEIINNVFEENTIGINLEGSTRINYKNNNFIRNGWAIKIAGACYANIFFENNFLHNSFDISYNSKLNDNEFSSNYWSSYTGYDLDKNGIGDIPYRPVKLFSYVVNNTPETIVLLRSLFVDIINFSEKVSPVFTPDDLMDNVPLMKPIK